MSTFAFMCYICSFVLCFGYIFTVIQIKGLISSISSSYYLGFGGWFQFWAIGTSFLMLPAWLEVSGESYQWVAFLSVVALCAVGTMPRFREDDAVGHAVSAILSGVLAFVWCGMAGVWHIPICLLAIALFMSIWLYNSKTFLLEVAGFVSIYMGMIII